jgi:hypothetical protein
MSATPRTLGWLGKFVFQNGTVVRVSGTGSDIVFNDGTGSATFTDDRSFRISQLLDKGNGDVPDGDIVAPVAISDAWDAEDVFAGAFEGMQVTLHMIDWTNPAAGSMQRGPYTVSEIAYDDRGKIAAFELRGILQRAKQISIEEFSVSCRSPLGDQRAGYCALPLYPDDRVSSSTYQVGSYIRVADAGGYHDRMFRCTTAGVTAAAPPTYNYPIGATTTDGSAVFTSENAWVHGATVATVIDADEFTIAISEARAVNDWYNEGGIKWLSGPNAGSYNTVRDWTQSTSKVMLWGRARYTVSVGDTLEIVPGCDKRFETCQAKFDNTINFRGENLLPGRDFLNGAG